jgi:peptidoglycan/LPS O-acetylase OafA/YrhL
MVHYLGFDILRILAATSVVFSHAFLIAEATEANEPFQVTTGEIVGVYGVMIFFILSGFLVTDSAMRSSSIGAFFGKRARRILPAFLICNLICVLVIAPFYVNMNANDFFLDHQTWKHLASVLTMQNSSLYFNNIEFYQSTPGNHSTLPLIVNGVLWTIRLEVACYLIVGALLFTRLLNRRVVLILTGLSVFLAFSYTLHLTEFLGGLFFLLPSFAAGMVLCVLGKQHQACGNIALLCLVILACLAFMQPTWQKQAAVLFPLLVTYPLLWFGQLDLMIGQRIRRLGDPSYGMYLWGWPIQQVVRSFCADDMSGYAFFFISMPFVVLAGYLSWYLFEVQFLRSPKRPVREVPAPSSLVYAYKTSH